MCAFKAFYMEDTVSSFHDEIIARDVPVTPSAHSTVAPKQSEKKISKVSVNHYHFGTKHITYCVEIQKFQLQFEI